MRTMLTGILLAVGVTACGPKLAGPCIPRASRCFENRVELCSPEKKWMLVMDCAKTGADWACKETDDGHSCARNGGN